MPEIGTFEPLRQITLAGRRFQHDIALHQRVDAIGGGKRLFQQLFDQQHRGALLAQLRDDVEHAIDQHRRQAGRGFVEHQQPRPAHQALRHRQHLLLPAAERAAALVTLLGNFGKERQGFLDPRRALAARQVVARQQQIVGDGNLGEHAMAFDHMHEPGARGLARRGVGHVAAVEAHMAGIDRQQSRQRAQHGGLAGAVGAEQRHHFAGRDLEVDAMQHADLAVAGFQRFDREQRFSRRGKH